MEPHWTHVEHDADIGIRGYGQSPSSAFEQAAMALTAVVTDLALVSPKQSIKRSWLSNN